MKIFFILTLCVIGASATSPLSYPQLTYHYSGRLTTGIPEISDQASGFSIYGTVIIMPDENNSFVDVQFQDFRFGEFNEELGCNLEGDIQLDFKPLENNVANRMLETPFQANIYGGKDHALIVGKDELMWVTNLKKAIMSTFKIELPLYNYYHKNQNITNDKSTTGNHFTVKEETIHGKCSVDYNLHELREDIAAEKSHQLQQQRTQSDVHFKGSDGNPSYDRLWCLTRTVNFDKCDYRVSLQKAPYSMPGTLAQNQVGYLKGRSSISHYTLRGSLEHGFRVEEANILGVVSKSPFAINTELIQVRSNQTFQLKYQGGGYKLFLPEGSKIVKTWAQEIKSSLPPLFTGVNKDPWINFTGLGDKLNRFEVFGVGNFSAEDYASMKHLIISSIHDATKSLSGEDQTTRKQSGEVTNLLHYASWHGQVLSKTDLIEIINYFLSKNSTSTDNLAASLIIDVISSIGTKASTEAVVEIIIGGKVPIPQVLSFASSLTNNIGGPESIPILMDLTKHLIKSHEKKESSAIMSNMLLNMANLLHVLCLSPKAATHNYMGPFYGDQKCHFSVVYDEILSLHKSKIYDPKSPKWEKLLAIESLTILSTPAIIPILKPLILAKSNDSCKQTEERALAIYALDGFKLQKMISEVEREQVKSLLLSLVMNTAEKETIRESALAMRNTWGIEPQFWIQLARMTWNEPSTKVAYYISIFIQTFARVKDWRFKQTSQSAAFAATLAKPMAESDKYSQMYLEATKNVEKHVSKMFYAIFEKNPENINELNMFFIKHVTAGGFSTNVFELFLRTSIQPYIESIMKSVRGIDSSTTIVESQNILQDILKTLNVKTSGDVPIRSDTIYLRMFEHMRLILQFSPSNLHGFTKVVEDINKKLDANHTWTWGTYHQPHHIVDIHSTDFGMPLFSEVYNPIVKTSTMKLTIADKKNFDFNKLLNGEFQFELEKVSRFATSSSSYMAVLGPWSNSIFKASSVANRELTLPLKCKLNLQDVVDNGSHKRLHINIDSLYTSKFKFLRAENNPITSIEPIMFIPRLRIPDYKSISKFVPKESVSYLPKELTGLNTKAIWSSEMRCPFTTWNLIKCLSDPNKLKEIPLFVYLFTTPTLKYWRFELEHDPEASQTKSVNLTFMLGVYGKTASRSDFNNLLFTKTVDDTIDNRASTDSNKVAEELFKNDIVGPNLKYEDTLEQRSTKLEAFYGHPVPSCNLKVVFDGPIKRSYELLHTWSRVPWYNQWKHSKSQIAFFRSAIPGIDSQPSSVCINKENLASDPSLDYLQSSNISCHHRAELTIGCSGKPSIIHKSVYKVSDELQKSLWNSCRFQDTYDNKNLIKNNFIFDRVNCSLTWNSTELINDKKHHLLSIFVEGVHLLSSIIFFGQRSEKPLEDKLTTTLNRDILSGKWDVKVVRSDLEEQIDISGMDEHLDGCLSEKVFEYPDHYSVGGRSSEKCFLSFNTEKPEVRTFDGANYNFEPSNCWTVLAKDCSFSLGWILMIRNDTASQIGLRFISEYDEFYIDILGDDVKLNGKAINITGGQLIDDSGKEVKAQIYHANDVYTIRILDDFHISVSKKNGIIIDVPEQKYNRMCGLCGNYDRELVLEFAGPQQCYYSTPDAKFISSWTVQSDQCDAKLLTDIRSGVLDYQNGCRTTSEIKETCPSYQTECTVENKYTVVHNASRSEICLSADQVSYCPENCSQNKNKNSSIKFNCWSEKKAPSKLFRTIAERKNHLLTPIKNLHGATTKMISVDHSVC